MNFIYLLVLFFTPILAIPNQGKIPHLVIPSSSSHVIQFEQVGKVHEVSAFVHVKMHVNLIEPFLACKANNIFSLLTKIKHKYSDNEITKTTIKQYAQAALDLHNRNCQIIESWFSNEQTIIQKSPILSPTPQTF